MSTICEPQPYDAASVSVSRQGPGNYALEEHHHHEGQGSWCPLSDRYTNLTWDEAMELAITVLDARRPGMMPQGWEQLGLPL